ncbi:MAG TPA: DUF4386 domain-containing protein [Pyrinomonadaceae bacterium]|nr:DUF4386 domain-containing protein [Pyrinomonadaceae bacterium]
MKTGKKVGRMIGVLLLALFLGLMAGFVLLAPAVTKDYLNLASAMPRTIRIAVMLLLADGGIALAIAVAAYPVFREYSRRMAVALTALGAVWVTLQAADNAYILSMLSLSTQYAGAGGESTQLYNVLGAQLRSTRVWMHFTTLLSMDVWCGLFYALLYRFSLVPRPLAGIGLLAVMLHSLGISLSAFVGFQPAMSLGIVFGLSFVLIGGWLAVKGMAGNE